MSASEPLPQALKVPEVSRFLNRANQIRSIKPAITYWCMFSQPACSLEDKESSQRSSC